MTEASHDRPRYLGIRIVLAILVPLVLFVLPDERPPDTDRDGTPDYLDSDSDGDGLDDGLERPGDSDGDGVPDRLDADSFEPAEPGADLPVAAHGGEHSGGGDRSGLEASGILSLPDSDGDGIPDRVEAERKSRGPITLLPALLAISLAFATGRAVLPLLCGVWLGATMLAWGAGARFLAPIQGAWATIDDHIVRAAIYDPGGGGIQTFQLGVLGFIFALVGMVSITIRGGGMAGVAQRFAVLAESARATRLATWAMGLVIFFDDYANTMVVGGSMRPLADRTRVSREKLAWIVDSTAAPVAGLSILSTWVAFEISQFSPQLPLIGRLESEGYAVFLETLPFRFYCIFTLVFVGLICWTNRDFGPMRKAELRALRTGAVFRPGGRPMSAEQAEASQPKAGVRPRARIAVIPVLLTVGSLLGLFVYQGEIAGHADHLSAGMSILSTEHLRAVLSGVEDTTRLLFLASVFGLLVAAVMVIVGGILTPREVLAAVFSGSRAMGVAVSILLLAWAMAQVCDEDHLGTRQYLASLAEHTSPILLPMILFFLACGISFATGSSWATMGILLPSVILLAVAVGEQSVLGGAGMVIITIGAVLDGSIFGDHCSPISDTTILSSTATGSDHMDHVTTQAPYACVVMVVAMLCGYLPAAMGAPPLLSLVAGVGALVTIVLVVGRPLRP
ncbi:MAG: Na+/H+ antiporter NhaC family protein [Myxococcota bacterium]|nr:Na+/H+ antiporter NhaC family protein [Myxococcota bacterium]